MSINLLNLANEVLQMILVYVNDSSPSTSNSLRLTSKLLADLVRDVQAQSKVLLVGESISGTFERRSWVSDQRVLRNLRHLTVNRDPDYETWEVGFTNPDQREAFLKRFEVFNRFIRQIKSLKCLVWNLGPIPETLLATLTAYQPTATLRIYKYARFDRLHRGFDASEVALSCFPRFTHLRLSGAECTGLADHIEHYSGESRTLATIKWIISKCQGLKYVGLISSRSFMQLTDVGTGYGVTRGSHNDSRCQTLERLTVDVLHEPLTPNTLEDLGKYIDLSKIQYAKLSRGMSGFTQLNNFATLLPNLQHIALNLRNAERTDSSGNLALGVTTARTYLLSHTSVKTLSLWSCRDIVTLSELLAIHGKSLEELQLHEREQDGQGRRMEENETRITTSLEDVQLIREQCPRLRRLTLDINLGPALAPLHELSELCRILDEVAAFTPRLDRVQIYLDTQGLANHILEWTQQQLQLKALQANGGEQNDEPRDSNNAEVRSGKLKKADSDDIQLGNHIESELDDGVRPTTSTSDDSNQQISDLEGDVSLGLTLQQQKIIVSPPSQDKHGRLEEPESMMQDIIESIWVRLFGNDRSGRRQLDIKIGEWESYEDRFRYSRFAYDNLVLHDPRRWYHVLPHERDDMIGKVGVCKISQRLDGGWRTTHLNDSIVVRQSVHVFAPGTQWTTNKSPASVL